MERNNLQELEEMFKEYCEQYGYSKDTENTLQKCKNFLLQSKNYWIESIENIQNGVIFTVTNGNYTMYFECDNGYITISKVKK